MNKIDELVLIISSFGGEASLEDICKQYGKNHHMVMFTEHKAVILNTLKNNSDKTIFDKTSMKWKIKTPSEDATKRFLYVKDDKSFSTIRKAMSYIFNKNVPSQGGYFNVDETHDAWFPQPFNSDWKNELSDDGKHWFETPFDKKNLTIPSLNLRYTFIKKDGYRFTGVFKFSKIDELDRRVYDLIDDKVRILTLEVTPEEENIRKQYEAFILKKAAEEGKNTDSSVPNTVALYSRSIKQISDYLYSVERITKSLYLIDDIGFLNQIYEELLHGSGYLREWNKKGNNTLSSSVKRLAEMKQESGVLSPRFFFRPTVVTTWDYFKEKGLVGDIETFSATSDMRIGDYLVVYVGKKGNEKEAGVYALSEIVEKPFTNTNKNDVSYGKTAVKARYLIVSEEVLISYEKSLEIAKQTQNAHLIEEEYYPFLRKTFGL